MPNIDTLIDSIVKIIPSYQTELPDESFGSTIDLKYAQSQLILHPNTARHSNFNIASGDMTGTYRFKFGFLKLTNMTAEFQKN